MTWVSAPLSIRHLPTTSLAPIALLAPLAPLAPHNNFPKSNRPRLSLSGPQRSPRRLTRAGTLSMRKSSIAIPFSISFHETGVDTGARGRGRGEYTDASVRPHAFWL